MPGNRHHVDVQVRFSDTDAIGHINNACFATYTELARLDFFRMAGLRLESLILARLAIDYKRQVILEDRVAVETWVEALGRSSITLRQTVLANGEIAAIVDAVLVCFNYDLQRSEPLPDELRTWLETRRGATSE
jgi:acyl-CoA thioester hydrolase